MDHLAQATLNLIDIALPVAGAKLAAEAWRLARRERPRKGRMEDP